MDKQTITEHDLLCKKLLLCDLADESHKLITSFLTSREQVVCLNSSKSTEMAVNYGVPQGSLLCPLLFSIYVNDFPLHISELHELFCYDTAIHTSYQNLYNVFKSLQVSVDKLSIWSQLNHMSLNPIKAKCMVITTRQNRQNIFAKLPNLLVEKEFIETVDSHRVLRVVTDNNLIWHDHVNSLTKKSLEKCASTVQSQKLPKFAC